MLIVVSRALSTSSSESELNFKGSLQSLGKSEDFLLALSSSQEIIKLKKITCSYFQAVFATGKNCYRLKMDI